MHLINIGALGLILLPTCPSTSLQNLTVSTNRTVSTVQYDQYRTLQQPLKHYSEQLGATSMPHECHWASVCHVYNDRS